ncbi:MAG: molybdopterin-dependent oxidoreductase, partial [Steroidobacteraceae bacterium]
MTSSSSHHSMPASSARPAPGQDGVHVTFCRTCEAFCGMAATVEGGRVTKISPDRLNPFSTGHICVKGPAIRQVAYDPDRITRPLRRIGAPGEFEPVSWDDALDDIARRLTAITTTHGKGAAAAYTGNPAAFVSQFMLAFGLLADLGISKYFSASSQDANPRLVASWLLYGGARRLPIPDLPRCDLLLIFGANPFVSHGSILTDPRIHEELLGIGRRGRVVVIDPRRTETADRFEHLSIVPDTDAWLLAAMLQVIFEEELADVSFLDSSTNGWRELRSAVAAITPERAARACGVSAEEIRSLARAFSKTPHAAAYSRVGLCRGRFSTIAVVLLDALNIVAGKFARPGGWVFADSPIDTAPHTGGYDPSRTRLGALPTVIGKMPSIVLPQEMLLEGKERIRALAVIAGNPALSTPGGANWIAALESLDLHFSIDLYVNETNRHAHYILPTTTFLEREDVPLLGWSHMVRPFAQYTDAVIPPLGESRVEHEILQDLRARIGRMRAAAPEAQCDENPLQTVDALLAQGTRNGRFANFPDGLSLDTLKQFPHGVMLGAAGDADSWQQKVGHADGRIALWSQPIAAELKRLLGAEATSTSLRLIGRRELRSINSWMHHVKRLARGQTPTL